MPSPTPVRLRGAAAMATEMATAIATGTAPSAPVPPVVSLPLWAPPLLLRLLPLPLLRPQLESKSPRSVGGPAAAAPPPAKGFPPALKHRCLPLLEAGFFLVGGCGGGRLQAHQQ